VDVADAPDSGDAPTAKGAPRSIERIRDALEHATPAFLEIDSRAEDQGLDRAGYTDLPGRRLLLHAGRYVNRDAGDVVTTYDDFARMQPDTHLEADGAKDVTQPDGTLNRTCRTIEAGKDTITHGLHHDSRVACEQVGYDSVVRRQDLLPFRVTKRRRSAGGVHDVQKQDRSEHSIGRRARNATCDESLCFIEDAVGVTRKERMIESWKLEDVAAGGACGRNRVSARSASLFRHVGRRGT